MHSPRQGLLDVLWWVFVRLNASARVINIERVFIAYSYPKPQTPLSTSKCPCTALILATPRRCRRSLPRERQLPYHSKSHRTRLPCHTSCPKSTPRSRMTRMPLDSMARTTRPSPPLRILCLPLSTRSMPMSTRLSLMFSMLVSSHFPIYAPLCPRFPISAPCFSLQSLPIVLIRLPCVSVIYYLADLRRPPIIH